MTDYVYDPMKPQVVKRSTKVKISANGKVVVLLTELLRMADGPDILQYYCMQDDGAWHLLSKGEEYTPMSNVYVQDKNDPAVDLTN